MLPRFKNLSSIAIYTPDLQRAIDTYLELGLRTDPRSPNQSSPTSPSNPTELTLHFTHGDATLVLHNDPQRQFVELNVDVDDVTTTYEHLARHPHYTWLETPHPDPNGWKAVVRLPDDNVFTLRSTHPTPTTTPDPRKEVTPQPSIPTR